MQTFQSMFLLIHFLHVEFKCFYVPSSIHDELKINVPEICSVSIIKVDQG
jgi:hypothetical protein